MNRAMVPLVLAAIAAGCGSGDGGGDDRPPPPNVLIVVMDATRADHCTLLGYDRPTTPRLENLAGDGVVFRNAYTSAPVCVPDEKIPPCSKGPEATGDQGWHGQSRYPLGF